MSITYRPATLQDAQAIATLLRALPEFHFAQQETSRETESRLHQSLSACLADASHSIHLAWRDVHLAGYLAIHWLPYLILKGPEGFISELFIHPDYRSQGIGKTLIHHAQGEAQTRGCSRLSLLNMRDKASYQRAFYGKNHWVERPEAANFLLSPSVRQPLATEQKKSAKGA